ncbi:MAG: addiction module protein [Cellulomonadaceae bacterium]|jgi:putative addiction module component (TIGR02574 family)|nr:addiction module protein [Cellulomonadaceae bacterium]
MTVLTEDIRQSLLHLPADDRLTLAHDLLTSVSDAPDMDEEVESAWGVEIRRRINHLVSGTVETIPGHAHRERMAMLRAAAHDAAVLA